MEEKGDAWSCIPQYSACLRRLNPLCHVYLGYLDLRPISHVLEEKGKKKRGGGERGSNHGTPRLLRMSEQHPPSIHKIIITTPPRAI